MPWKIAKEDNQWCVHKETADGGLGETVACHESEAKAQAQLRALYANEERMSAADRLVDDFVVTSPGEPYRLFPWGALVKNGKRREVKPGMGFRLPHFKPAIKLGSHDDTTPAGGHIVGLEERADGLYAIPEMNERGAAVLNDGAYRYHSPEVIWEGAGFENPLTGETIPGPLIVGDALLHMPHLGEAAALYSVESMEVNMTESVTIPASLWDKFMAKLFPDKPAEEPPAPPEVKEPEQDNFAALSAERDEYKARLESLEAEAARKSRIDGFAAQLAETKAEPNAEILAGMTDEQAAWVVQQFKALSAQINESALTAEIGSEGAGTPANPYQALDLAVRAKMADAKVNYAAALQMVGKERPELVAAYKNK